MLLLNRNIKIYRRLLNKMQILLNKGTLCSLESISLLISILLKWPIFMNLTILVYMNMQLIAIPKLIVK